MYALAKLLTFVKKVTDCEAIILTDNGKNLVIGALGSSTYVRAVLPTTGTEFDSVAIEAQTLIKTYREEAKFSGTGGELVMHRQGWRLKIMGEARDLDVMESIEGSRLKLSAENAASIKSVPIEDSFGGNVWASFLPTKIHGGVVAITTAYSMVAIGLDTIPTDPFSIPVSVIAPLLTLKDAVAVSNDDQVQIKGGFQVAAQTSAKVTVILAKPVEPPPTPREVQELLGGMPIQGKALAISAAELKTCITSMVNTFGDDATNVTLQVTKKHLGVGLTSAKMDFREALMYVNPSKRVGTISVNTEILQRAFKGMANLTSVNSICSIEWDDTVTTMLITDDKGKTLGMLALANSQEWDNDGNGE